MLIPIKKLFEYDEFKITGNELLIKITWHDYMNKNSFINKVEGIINELEEMPIGINFNGESVELLYLIIGGIDDNTVQLY